jgi:hypothetical protein
LTKALWPRASGRGGRVADPPPLMQTWLFRGPRSVPMQLRIEDWPADGAFEIASEAEFQLWAINWRRRQPAAKRLNVSTAKT